jgi:excisionase family DNA binding protein
MSEKENRKENNSREIGLARLLIPDNVAEILGISVKTVHKLVREGKLGCVQVTSKERRFTEEQVRAYINAKSRGIQEVRVDRKHAPRVSSEPKKGGKRSFGVSKADLRKEMSQWR